jgi:hypothetical protein
VGVIKLRTINTLPLIPSHQGRGKSDFQRSEIVNYLGFGVISDREKTLIVILLAFVLYLPFIFMGYGSDIDSHGIIQKTSKSLIESHRYVPSRYPGYFVHEIATTALFLLGGSLATNLGTMVMSLLTVYFFIRVCGHHKIPHGHLLSVFLIIQPLYWVASTSTIDYLWALGLLFIGYGLLINKRHIPAGILFGLAIGARLSSVVFVTALLVSYLVAREPDRIQVLFSAVISAIVGSLMYIPSYIHAGSSLGFLTYFMDEWDWTGYLARFVYKNIYFWGLQTVVALLFITPLIIRGLRGNYEIHYRTVITFSILVIAGFEAMYLKVPLEKAYLLPMLPFALMLLGISLKNHRWIIILLTLVQFSYNFLNINIAKPDIPRHATTATVGLWLEWGYLITDIINRLRMMS